MALELELSLKQKLAMTQQMQLAVKILQMNALDLELYLQEATLENPVLELESCLESDKPDDIRLKRLEWLDRMDESNSFRYMLRPDDNGESPLYEKNTTETLAETLVLQLSGMHLPASVERVVRCLIENLDENGYLTTLRQQLLDVTGSSNDVLDAALEALWKMDPPGVGAPDLRGCLLIQARRLETPSPILCNIIENHLDVLAKNQLNKLASAMGVSLEDVKDARALLLTLNPKPGNGFSEQQMVPYIRPDLFVVHFEEGFEVIYNDYMQPKLDINAHYRSMIGETDIEAAAYLKEKLACAQSLIASINQRRSTVLSCAKAVLSRQVPFFKHGPGHLLPMTLADIAGDIGIHVSTVSRAVSGKYLQSQWGVQRLGDFFSRSVSKESGGKTQDMVLIQLRRIIEEEDSAAPYSDQKLTEKLSAAGIAISRRTVAKYREQAGIPPAVCRKQF